MFGRAEGTDVDQAADLTAVHAACNSCGQFDMGRIEIRPPGLAGFAMKHTDWIHDRICILERIVELGLVVGVCFDDFKFWQRP